MYPRKEGLDDCAVRLYGRVAASYEWGEHVYERPV